MPLNDLFAAIRWWVILLILGTASAPLVFVVLRRLPDRGYAFVKMAGVLVVTYLFWLLGSLGFLGNDLGGILFSLALVAAASFWVLRRSDLDIASWVRDNRRQILVTELVFAVIFFFWAWVRAQNPAITGTEKPMEFAFLNAVGRSAQMPPLDPWLSGFAISYYYFGYVMTSVIARLALVPEPMAFNLGIAWLAAGAAVGAFGVVYNLVASGRAEKARRNAMVLGLVAALAIPIAGNMQVFFEILHANGVGSEGFWSWLDVRDINAPPGNNGFGADGSRFWWWWRSSRVIHEYHLSGVAEEGLEPIAEFPGFSFLLGDMHPHVLALPFAFLGLALGLAWWLAPTRGMEQDVVPRNGLATRVGWVLRHINIPLYAATVLFLGGLSFLNTWDILSHLFIVVGAYVLNRWRRDGAWQTGLLREAALLSVALIVPAVILYLPFYIGFRSQAGPPFLLPMLMRPTRLSHFLIIFGMPLLVIVTFLSVIIIRRRRLSWRTGIAGASGLVIGLTLLMLLLGFIVAASAEGSARVLNLATELEIPLPPVSSDPLTARLGWALNAVAALAGPILLARLASPWMVLFLAVIIGVVIAAGFSLMEREEPTNDTGHEARVLRDSNVPFILLLILTGALLTLGPEFVYLRDNFGQRLNTIFKFYYQAWICFGIAAIYALDHLWQRARPAAIFAGLGYAAMLAVALLFPAYGIMSRAREYALPSTLNGLSHYTGSQPDELAALTWLRQNVDGAPVIVEAVGGQYSPQGHGRVSASTGLPTLIGWPGSEYQWRGATTVPAERESAVQTIYTGANWEETAALLDEHDVSLIYVGSLELSTYGPSAREKFDGTLEVAYANDSVMIYRWLPR